MENEERGDAMMAITSEEYDAMLAKQRTDYARYYKFLDEFWPAGEKTIGAWIDALRAEFGLDEGEAHGVHMHWLVSRSDGGTAEERAMWFGGM